MSYNTEQKKAVLQFLLAKSRQPYTIEEIARALTGVVGKSTVYRQIPLLVNEGYVRRFAGENPRKPVYQAVAGAHCDAHLHMKCVSCGKLLHMTEQISDKVIDMVQKESQFSVDEETVLYGKCSACNHKSLTEKKGQSTDGAD